MTTATVWSAGASLSLNTLVAPTESKRVAGLFFKVTTAGTTGSDEPNWPKELGQTAYDTNSTPASNVQYLAVSALFTIVIKEACKTKDAFCELFKLPAIRADKVPDLSIRLACFSRLAVILSTILLELACSAVNRFWASSLAFKEDSCFCTFFSNSSFSAIVLFYYKYKRNKGTYAPLLFIKIIC